MVSFQIRKSLVSVRFPEEASAIVLNPAYLLDGQGPELLPRCVPKDNRNGARRFSRIAYWNWAANRYIDDCIVPNRNGTQGYEDARWLVDEHLVSCNETYLSPSQDELWPFVTVFTVRNGLSSQLGEADGLLRQVRAKSLVLLPKHVQGNDRFGLIRPWESLDGVSRGKPAIFSCYLKKWRRLSSNLLGDVEPIAPIVVAGDAALVGLGTSPVPTPYGWFFTFHVVTSENPEDKEYYHFGGFLDPDDPRKLAAVTGTLVAPCDFPTRPGEDGWVKGATYFTNIHYNSKTGTIDAFITHLDQYNYFVKMSFRDILTSARPVSGKLPLVVDIPVSSTCRFRTKGPPPGGP